MSARPSEKVEVIAREKTVKAVKPGWRTTEWWSAVLFAAANLGAALSGALPPKWAAVIVGADAIAYKLARGLAKTG